MPQGAQHVTAVDWCWQVEDEPEETEEEEETEEDTEEGEETEESEDAETTQDDDEESEEVRTLRHTALFLVFVHEVDDYFCRLIFLFIGLVSEEGIAVSFVSLFPLLNQMNQVTFYLGLLCV